MAETARATQQGRPAGSTGIVRSRQKCFSQNRLSRRQTSCGLRVKRRGSPFLGSSTPPCPASEA
eukprot:7383089-Prymnesium_polylepis.1